jgi:hypothetical protein
MRGGKFHHSARQPPIRKHGIEFWPEQKRAIARVALRDRQLDSRSQLHEKGLEIGCGGH